VALFEKREPTGNWWRDHSLSITLVAALLIVTAVSVLSSYQLWQAEDTQIEFWIWYSHHFWTGFADEILGALLLVLFSKWFYERGSAESK
jgi:Na+-driven multidrug efflux pump